MENIVQKHEGRVSLIKGECVDHTRDNRKVLYKIYGIDDLSYRKRPLVIWSHGLGGGRDGAGFLARYLVEHGYFVMHIQHPGTDTSMWEGKDGHPWDVIRSTPVTRQMTLDRFKDVPFILDQLSDIERSHQMLSGQIDHDAIGMSGHSFGAMTAQVMSGQIFPDISDQITSFKEDRFKAYVFYSFSAMAHLIDAAPEDVFSDMDAPMLYMTGTQDDSPISGLDYTHRLPAYEHATSDDKHLLILEDGDHMVFTGSRGKLAFNPNRARQEEIIQKTSLAFWEAYLKSNSKAKDWLMSAQGYSAYLSDDGVYKFG